jgi:glycosyltransferase involved in cell wall biosynthesis
MVHHRLLMPDPQIAWLPWALAKSVYIAQREEAQVIYTSSPPNSSQLLGLLLKRILKKPWVADFRDPWTEGVRRKQAYVNNDLRGRLERSWERKVAERADHFIVSTEKNRDQFLSSYPFLESKLTVLTNGFDPDDFRHVCQEKRLLDAGNFNLTLTGNVETMFDAIPFFQAVRELLAESPEANAHLRVNFIGARKGKYDGHIRQNNLERHIRYVGYVPHADSVQYLAESDVLFFCQIPEYESAGVKLPGKLFEYLYMRKPIFALTVPGVTTDLLERAGVGVVAHPNDVAGIKQALDDLFQQWQQGRWRVAPNEEFICSFDRVRLTERLASIFASVTKEPSRSSVTSHQHVQGN